jgi:hypothetical protein
MHLNFALPYYLLSGLSGLSGGQMQEEKNTDA